MADHSEIKSLEDDHPESSKNSAKWRSAAGWLIWATVAGGSAWHLVSEAMNIPTESPDSAYIAFVRLWMDSLVLGSFSLLATFFVVFLSSISRWPFWWLLSIILTIAGWAAVANRVDEIEFVRTPPCCGMHSTDPGSGCNCPTGMREDFTLAELRQYYKAKRD